MFHQGGSERSATGGAVAATVVSFSIQLLSEVKNDTVRSDDIISDRCTCHQIMQKLICA